MKTDRRMLLGVGSGMIAGALWGLVFLTPELVRGFTPLQFSAARYLAYGIVAVVLLGPRWRAMASLLGRAEWAGLLWLSLLGNIVYYVFLVSAIQLGGIAPTSLIVGLLPIAVTLVGSRDHDAVPLRTLMPSLLLAVMGVGLISIQSLRAERLGGGIWQHSAGLLCAAGALASWTAYAVMNSRWLARLPHVSAHDWSLLTGVVTGGVALFLAVPAFVNAAHSKADWLWFWGVSSGIALTASILGNAFWNRASRLLPLTMAGQMVVFETLFALLYAFLWERRLPNLIEISAIVLLIASVLWCASSHRSAIV